MKTALDEINPGDVVYADDGFDCMKAGKHHVKADSDGRLYVDCSHGAHYLDGQLDFDKGTSLVGISKEPF